MDYPSASISEKQKRWMKRAAFLSPFSVVLGVGYLISALMFHPPSVDFMGMLLLGMVLLIIGIYGLAYYVRGTYRGRANHI